jgi:hypothetical protein
VWCATWSFAGIPTATATCSPRRGSGRRLRSADDSPDRTSCWSQAARSARLSTLACFACALSGPVSGGVIVEPGLRSEVEDRWRGAYQTAGSGELSALRDADPELVREDSERLAGGLRRIIDRLPDRGRALAVGHSPTNEAAVFGLTGELVAPISKGGGVLVVADADSARVEPLP